jgi:hypothetical protein
MRKSLLMVLAAFCTIVLSGSVALAAGKAAENWLGTWKLDLAKSTYTPGPAPKSLTLKFKATPGGIKFTADGVGADGKATHSTFLSKFDGKDVPYEGNPDADMASPKKVDNNSYNNTWKKGGKPRIATNVVVSADGKTMTITQTGTNGKNQTVSNTAVYNKQ